jgi:hypothetical protein
MALEGRFTIRVLAPIAVLCVITIGVVIYLLTQHPTQEDPCLAPQNDLSAAVLGDGEEQSALTNRAMLQRANCETRKNNPP